MTEKKHMWANALYDNGLASADPVKVYWTMEDEGFWRSEDFLFRVFAPEKFEGGKYYVRRHGVRAYISENERDVRLWTLGVNSMLNMLKEIADRWS